MEEHTGKATELEQEETDIKHTSLLIGFPPEIVTLICSCHNCRLVITSHSNIFRFSLTVLLTFYLLLNFCDTAFGFNGEVVPFFEKF